MSSDADYGQIAGPRVHHRSAASEIRVMRPLIGQITQKRPLIGQMTPILASDWSRQWAMGPGLHPSLGHIKLVIV